MLVHYHIPSLNMVRGYSWSPRRFFLTLSYTLRGIFLSPASLAVTDSTCIFSHVDCKKQKKRGATISCAAFQSHHFPSARGVFTSLWWIGLGIDSALTKVTFHLENPSWFSSWKHEWMCCFRSLVAVALVVKTKIVVNDEFGSMLCSYPGCII